MINTLSNIRNHLLTISGQLDMTADINKRADLIGALRKMNNNTEYIDKIAELIQQYDSMTATNQHLLEKIQEFTNQVDYDLEHLSETVFNREHQDRLFDESKLVQPTQVDDAVYTILCRRLGNYSNWRYPGLVVNPRSKRWIDTVVSCDPLYLTKDKNLVMLPALDSLISTFPDIYQRRLRLYEHQDQTFDLLPQGQFGLVLIWDMFNFLSLNKIEPYLNQIFNLLRPGGVVLFSYTNADDYESTKLIDKFFVSYNSRKHMTSMAERIGFEVIQFEDVANANHIFPTISWGEFKRPGTLKTNKAHQVLPELVAK